MTTATLIKKPFNWGGSLIIYEVQSIIVKTDHGVLNINVVLE